MLRLKTADETVIAPALNELSSKMADTLSIGSYPVSAQRDGAGIVISLEGVSSAAIAVRRKPLERRSPDAPKAASWIVIPL